MGTHIDKVLEETLGVVPKGGGGGHGGNPGSPEIVAVRPEVYTRALTLVGGGFAGYLLSGYLIGKGLSAGIRRIGEAGAGTAWGEFLTKNSEGVARLISGSISLVGIFTIPEEWEAVRIGNVGFLLEHLAYVARRVAELAKVPTIPP